MQIRAVQEYLAQGLEIMGLSLDNQADSLVRLARYFEELLKWNKKVNLVARTLDKSQILENHFLDSLTLLSILPEKNRQQESFLDIGTGAGFPGLVVKTACPELPVTLLEPRQNRFYFLKHIIRLLQLQDVDVLDVRLEKKQTASKLSGQQFSFITSRAFAASRDFIDLAAPYLKRKGRLVLMKGPGAVDKMDGSGWRNLPAGFYVAETVKLKLPFSKKERWLVTIRLHDEQSGDNERKSSG